MSLSQKGALYDARDAIAGLPESPRELGRHLLRALDSLASQNEAIRQQGNFGLEGPPAAPHSLDAIGVAAANGFVTVRLTHAQPPAGVRYVIEYSTTPNFLNPVRIDNGISTSFSQYLHGQTLYWRAAPTFLTSGLGSWIYFGGLSTPTAVVI